MPGGTTVGAAISGAPGAAARASQLRAAPLRSRLGNSLDVGVALLLVALLLLFVAYPLFCIFQRGLVDADTGLPTLDYLSQVWQRYRTPLANSVLTGLCTAAACTVFSAAVAVFVSTRRGLVKKILMLGLLISMVSPPFVSSLAYVQLYGRRGWITFGLLGLSVDPYGFGGVVLMQTLSFIPLSALLLVGILDKMDRDAVNAARDLGAGSGHVLADIVLRLMRPGIVVVLLLTFVRSLADFGTPIIIGGRFSTIAAEIYLQVVGYSDLNLSAAMNVFLLAPSLVAFFAYRRFMRQSDRLMQAGRGRQGSVELRLCASGPLGWGALLLSVFFYVVNLLQYLCVFLAGFMLRKRGVYTFSLEAWSELWSYDLGTLGRSVCYALIVALVGTLFAMVFAAFVSRRRIFGSTVWDCLATLPFMLPGPCFGLGYILAFNHAPLQLTGTALIVMANMLFKQLPTTSKICAASLAQIQPATELAVRDMGGSRAAVMKDAVLPQLRPAFLSCFSYNFTSSMTTAGAVLFLIAPGQKLAVFTLFDAVYRGDYAIASLMATAIIVATVLVEAVVFGLVRLAGQWSARRSGLGAAYGPGGGSGGGADRASGSLAGHGSGKLPGRSSGSGSDTLPEPGPARVLAPDLAAKEGSRVSGTQ